MILRSRRFAGRASPCELIHPLVAEDLPRGEVLVRPAEQPAVVDRRRAAARDRLDVVELDLVGGATDSTSVESPLAPPAVPLPDGSLDVGGDVLAPPCASRPWWCGRGGLGRRRVLPRLLDEPPALRVTLQDEIEPGLDDLLRAGARVRVRERGASGVELVEEA